jgi:hypothetical protein
MDELSSEPRPGLTYSKRDFVEARLMFSNELTRNELDACLYYSHQGDRILNSAYRYNMLGRESEAYVAKMADDLNRAIAKHPMPRDTYVMRGMSGPWTQAIGDRLKAGDHFVEPGYTSTSATAPFGGEMTMRIKIPRGAAAAPIPTRYASEDEFLLPPGTKFRVVNNTRTVAATGSVSYHLELEVVP